MYVSGKMLYQLPSGKVIYLSIEEYLSLDDRELHELAHSGYGDDAPVSMFYGKQERRTKDEDEPDLDYNPEDDETPTTGPIDINNLPEED